jgi:hypothetical protein
LIASKATCKIVLQSIPTRFACANHPLPQGERE